MAKNYYHRSFIILKPEDDGYGLAQGKRPTGYCKLEIRRDMGKVQLYIQDLKPGEELGGVYDVYLVSVSQGLAPQRLAGIQVDDRGRGECTVEFSANDIKNSGYSLEQFHALAVVFRSLDNKGEVKVGYPLVGYSSKHVEVDWSGRVMEDLKRVYANKQTASQALEDEEARISEDQAKDAGETKKNSENIDEIDRQNLDNVEDTKAPEVQGNKEIQDSKSEHDEDVPGKDEIGKKTDAIEDQAEGTEAEKLKRAYESTYEEFSDDVPPEAWQQDNEEDLKNIGSIPDEKINAKEEGQPGDTQGNYGDAYQGTYWANVKDYFSRLFKTHKLVQPFEEDMGEAEWIRVQQAEPAYPGNYTYPGNYIGMQYRYAYPGYPYFDHYIVGLIREKGKVRYVVYGIPSLYSMMPPTYMSGFSRWLPVKNGYGMGYWLIYIDAETGSVVYPY